jgi:hypothetical protein
MEVAGSARVATRHIDPAPRQSAGLGYKQQRIGATYPTPYGVPAEMALARRAPKAQTRGTLNATWGREKLGELSFDAPSAALTSLGVDRGRYPRVECF